MSCMLYPYAMSYGKEPNSLTTWTEFQMRNKQKSLKILANEAFGRYTHKIKDYY